MNSQTEHAPWQKQAAIRSINETHRTGSTPEQEAHVWSMLERWPDDSKTAKQGRWLGFIQGWCWALGVPLEDLKEINRSESQTHKAAAAPEELK